MKVSLTKGLDEQQVLDLKGSFTAALQFRKAVIRHIERKINERRKKSSNEDFILEGDFAQRMAWDMGYERAQRDHMELMKGDK